VLGRYNMKQEQQQQMLMCDHYLLCDFLQTNFYMPCKGGGGTLILVH